MLPSVLHRRDVGRCCDHRAIVPDEDLHRHANESIAQADALRFGRAPYEMMESLLGASHRDKTRSTTPWMVSWKTWQNGD